MEDLAAKTLPTGFGYEWTELAYQQKTQGNTASIVFALAVVFVFLLLAAQYESLVLPFAVILIVPMCLLAAIVGVNLRGFDNNILTQIGLVVLSRAGGQERDPDRRVRQAGRGARRGPLESGRARRAHPAAADPDDVVRLHPRCRAAGLRQRGRGRRCARRSAPRCSSA